MSKFSGKCDFYDVLAIHGAENVVANCDVYAARHIIPLRFRSPDDLVPYYPYLVTTMSTGGERGTIYLSAESYVDTHERMMLEAKLRLGLKVWRSAHRKGEAASAQEIARAITYQCTPRPDEYELAQRIARDGDKAVICGVHIEICDYYRAQLIDEMTAHGWSEHKAREWCYGTWNVL